MIHGLDTWSAYTVDWKRIAADPDEPRRFVYAKCTEGGAGYDSKFSESVAGAKDAGIYVGGYAFLRLHQPIQPQIENFIRRLGGVGGNAGELPPALDCESPWPGDWAAMGLKADVVLDRIAKAAQAIRAEFGRPPMIYAGSGWWAGLAHLDASALKDCPLWAAAYWRSEPWMPAPTDRPKPFGPWDRVLMWQYSGDHSRPVPGVVSGMCPAHPQCQRVDRDVWLGTPEELDRLALVRVDREAPTQPVLPVDPGEGIADWAVSEYQKPDRT